MSSIATVSVNGRGYRAPDCPVVVVCIDGSEPEYFERALAERAMPALARFRQGGVYRLARAVVPSFTNPNNLSIVTGAPPSVHGISGNYFYDPATGQEVMMNDPKFLRGETLLAALSRAGARVAVITAKDKLRRLLGHEMRGICFSSERADQTTKAEHGIERATDLVPMPVPSVYSAELSEYVLAAGLELLRRERPDVMYLSLTDYVQHKHAPGAPAATAFYAMLDRYFDAFDRAGAALGITADHGMNAKSGPDGAPRVVYLRPLVDAVVGPGRARVILPITDPYVVHHGALGSFATLYLDDATAIGAVASRLAATPGIAAVYDNVTGSARFELPPDRVGDLIVIGDTHTVLGKSAEEHDLSLLEEPLRSHGGVSEQTVPFVINRRLDGAQAERLARADDLRNFDLFDFVLNGAS
jgi:phosphonoacetate hydrolase